MGQRRTGLNPLAYLGVEAITPPQLMIETRNPTVNDVQGYNLGTVWLVEPTEYIWMLVSLDGNLATWIQLYPAINVGALTFDCDVSSAVPVAGIIHIAGGSNINTSGATDVVTINLDNNVDITGPLTISGLGQGVVQSSAGGVLSSSSGNDGQVLISATGNPPSWANITAGANITVTNGANSITIASATTTTGTTSFVTGDAATSTPLAGVITFANGSNINTTSPGAAHTFVANLVNSPNVSGNVTAGTGFIAVTGDVTIDAGNVTLPATTGDGAQGQLKINGNRYVTSYGTGNTFIGQSSGNTTLTTASATDNTAVGFSVLGLVTTGSANTGFGDVALAALTTGSNNSGFGANSLITLTTGSNNVTLGYNSGSNYTGAESSNILINNAGTVGESNTIRLGTQGNGAGQQQDAYLAGVYAPITPLNATNNIAIVDLHGKLGTTVPTADGQLLIGSAAGAYAWQTITAGAGVAITNTANNITISSTGAAGGGVVSFITNAGTATEDVPTTSITIAGAGPINTTGVNHTVSIAMTAASSGQVLIGSTGNPAQWNTLTSDGTIGITNGAGTITLSAAAGGTTRFNSQTNATGFATPLAGIVDIVGGLNILTTGDNSHTITVLTPNFLTLPTTTDANNGVYKINNLSFLHAAGTQNTFAGSLAGNFAVTGSQNVGIGTATLTALSTGVKNTAAGFNAANTLKGGSNNVAIGYLSLDSGTSAVSNTAVGYQSLRGITSGQANIAIGYQAGANLVNTDSSNILIGNAGVAGDINTTRIGKTGTGVGQQTAAFMGGITPVAFAGTTLVTVNGNDKLGIIANGGTAPGQIIMFNAANNIGVGTITSPNNSLIVTPTNNTIGIETNNITWYAYQTAYTAAPVTGDGTDYILGTSAGFTKLFDTNNVISGIVTGQVLTVTIPVAGYYYIQLTVTGSPVKPPTALPPYPNPVPSLAPSPISIWVNGVSKWIYWGSGLDQTGYLIRVLSYPVVAQFAAGDKITFHAQANLVPLAATTYIGGGYLAQTNNIGVTYITGHLISPL